MESGGSRKDPGWKYATQNPNDKNSITCNFCQKVTNGGIYRAKQHLIGGQRNAKACAKCPDHVKEELREYMSKKKMEKEQEDMLLTHMPDFDDIDDEDEDEDDVQEIDQRGKRVSSSKGSSKSVQSKLKKPRQKGPMDAYFTPDPEMIVKGRKNEKGKQTTINDHYKKEAREKACQYFARWMYEAGLPFNAVKYDSFKVAIEAIGQYGVGMKPPSYHELRVPLLKKELAHTNNIMKGYKEEWAKRGCSIMSDGWKDKKERTLINFLVNCPKGTMFIESIDASAYSKTGERLFEMLDGWVEQVGEANVVQVITDSASNYVMAGNY